jgi:acyl-CoA thioester hydrolase
MSRPVPDHLDSYKYFLDIQTRWADNDVYGHVNNAVYYFYFDTVVNEFLISKGLLDYEKSETIGLVVKTNCDYFAPISFPDKVNAALRVSHIGTSSVTYEVGLFRNDENKTSAQGQFTHVYVQRDTRQPVAISTDIRKGLEGLKI